MKKKSKIFSRDTLIRVVVWFSILFLLFCIYVLGLQSPIKENTFYRVNPGSTISSVALDMKEKGYVSSDDLFKLSVKLQGNRMQSGEYELRPGYSVTKIAKMFNKGQVASTTILIPEGLTVKQIKNLLLEMPTLSGQVECDPANNLENPVCNLKEGDLFPDTYRVARGTNRLAVLELSRKKMVSVREGWEISGKPLPVPLKTWDEVIVLASIVQKETPKVSEMPVVASVYLNRLKKKMMLQADPTVVYAVTDGLGDMQGKGLYTKHLKTNSPYNTYMNYGLPPAPIANVGRNAIAAVLDPADTNYLFFVADGNGGHKFARTYEEHKKNHADWRDIKKTLNEKK